MANRERLVLQQRLEAASGLRFYATEVAQPAPHRLPGENWWTGRTDTVSQRGLNHGHEVELRAPVPALPRTEQSVELNATRPLGGQAVDSFNRYRRTEIARRTGRTVSTFALSLLALSVAMALLGAVLDAGSGSMALGAFFFASAAAAGLTAGGSVFLAHKVRIEPAWLDDAVALAFLGAAALALAVALLAQDGSDAPIRTIVQGLSKS